MFILQNDLSLECATTDLNFVHLVMPVNGKTLILLRIWTSSHSPKKWPKKRTEPKFLLIMYSGNVDSVFSRKFLEHSAGLCEETYSTQNLDWFSLPQTVDKKANRNSC